MLFLLLDLELKRAWYKLYPPRLINVATLPCESQSAENAREKQWK